MPDFVTKEEMRKAIDQAIKENNQQISRKLISMHDDIIAKQESLSNMIHTLARELNRRY